MQATAMQAIIPKARGMFAKRISYAEYEELMRRRTVPELAAMLKRHPYFKDSLATLSTIDPHRGQIEELLSMDVFEKYEALVRYDFTPDELPEWYLREVEVREVLRALQLLSIGLPGAYLNRIPTYLVGKTRLDLFALGSAANFEALLEVVRGTGYYKVLRARFLADPTLRDFPMTEAALLRYIYTHVLETVDRSLNGRPERSVKSLFLQEVESYNLELLLRVKTYFPTVYSTGKLEQLLIPFRYKVPKSRLKAMVEAETPDALMALYRNTPSVGYTGPATPEAMTAEEGRRTYRHARTILHLTASPMAALIAFISLAKLERDNVVNVIEGVRYGLSPEEIRPMLRY